MRLASLKSSTVRDLPPPPKIGVLKEKGRNLRPGEWELIEIQPGRFEWRSIWYDFTGAPTAVEWSRTGPLGEGK